MGVAKKEEKAERQRKEETKEKDTETVSKAEHKRTDLCLLFLFTLVLG